MKPRLLDLDRFGSRKYLQGLAREHRPLSAGGSVGWSLHEQVQLRWATALGIEADDLVLCGSAAHAWTTLSRCLLLPGDVAAIARPCPVELPAAVLGAGASFVDLGRSTQGEIQPAVVAKVAAAHANAVALGQRFSWFGTDDLKALAAVQWRAILIDATGTDALVGSASALDEGADAAVIALRDPDQPVQPLLWAIACRAGEGPGVAAIGGPGHLPLLLLRAGLASLDAIAAGPASHHVAWRDQLRQRREALRASLTDRPGVHWSIADGGVTAAALCLDGDVDAVAGPLRVAGFAATGFAPHPMRSAVVVDLAESTVLA